MHTVHYFLIFIDTSSADLLRATAWIQTCLQLKSNAKQTRTSAWQTYSNVVLEKIHHPNIPSWILVTVSRHALQALLDLNLNNNPAETDATIELSDDDKDIMQYVAGFVLHRIKRITSRLQESPSRRQKLELIDVLTRPEEEPETSTLITTLQRGGLMSVAEGIVPLFSKLELILREHLKLDQIVSQLSTNAIASRVYCDEFLVTLFDSMVESVQVPQDLKDQMMCEIVCTYIKTRISGYCRQQMQRMAQRMKHGKKQRSLRTTLQ